MTHAKVDMSGGPVRRAFTVVGRVLGWSVLGAICGMLLGFTIGVIHAPPVDPDYSLANEWYPVLVLLIMSVECVVGLLVGLGIAIAVGTPSNRRKAFAHALMGAVLGIGLTWVLVWMVHIFISDRLAKVGSELMLSLNLQAAGAIVGLRFAASRQPTGVKPLRSGYHSEEIDL